MPYNATPHRRHVPFINTRFCGLRRQPLPPSLMPLHSIAQQVTGSVLPLQAVPAVRHGVGVDAWPAARAAYVRVAGARGPRVLHGEDNHRWVRAYARNRERRQGSTETQKPARVGEACAACGRRTQATRGQPYVGLCLCTRYADDHGAVAPPRMPCAHREPRFSQRCPVGPPG